MKKAKQTILQFINFRSICIAILLAIFLILASAHTVSAADVTSNFTITSAKLFSGAQELTIERGIMNGVSFSAQIDWRYESDAPIADGDTVSFAFGTQNYNANGTNFHVRNSNDLPIKDANDKIVGYWNVNNRRMNIRFTDAAIGHYVIEGSISTARDYVAPQVVLSDKVVSFPIHNQRIYFTKVARSQLGALKDSYGIGHLATNGILYHDYYTPGITSNEFYLGNGQVALSSKAVFSDLHYETTFSPLATGASVNIYALAQLPLNITDGSRGAASEASWLNITKLFTRVNQTEGQSYEEFYASMQEKQYGIYRDENGRIKVAIKFGNQPSDITYSQAMAAANWSAGKRVGQTYYTAPEVENAMNLLDEPGTVTDGKVLRFVAEIAEILPASAAGATITNDSTVTYRDDEEFNQDKSFSFTIPTGTATATIIGEAHLRLVDEVTGNPIANSEFVLQEQNDNDEWTDADDTLSTTNADGNLQILNLTPGKNYRWRQKSVAGGYDTTSLRIRSAQPTRRGADPDTSSFTMPANAGVSFTATNTPQSYTVTYQLGAGSNDSDIVYTQAYGEATQRPDMSTITILDGYTFEGWDRAIAATVTEDATYVAKWSSVASTRGSAETPSASNVDAPLTYDDVTLYVAILSISSAVFLLNFPSALRAYRVLRYRH